ncbi:MAG: hypothetical protein RL662_2304 [Bacteroidota bacterium]|jgi:hypothetical protein
MRYIFVLYTLLVSHFFANAQHTAIDSVFNKIESKFSALEFEKIKREYNEADESKKHLMFNILSMPMSSKKELMDNYDQKHKDINELIALYKKMVPKDFSVCIELKSKNLVPGMVEAIDFLVYQKDETGELELIDGDWDMTYGSEELDQLLSIVGWDRVQLLMVKNLLQTANCISIQNNTDHYEISFARSGLGKYSYIIYPKKPNKKQLGAYTNECEFRKYKNNVILKYLGGMAGPQCFTD